MIKIWVGLLLTFGMILLGMQSLGSGYFWVWCGAILAVTSVIYFWVLTVEIEKKPADPADYWVNQTHGKRSAILSPVTPGDKSPIPRWDADLEEGETDDDGFPWIPPKPVTNSDGTIPPKS